MARRTSSLAPRERRHLRVRKRVSGTAERPRLNVFRSLNHIYAQIIDDVQGQTLASASSKEAPVLEQRIGKKKAEVAHLVGLLAGERARERGVQKVVFDRGGYKYHGRVKALAEGARQAGLEF